VNLRDYATTERQIEILTAFEANDGNATHTAEAMGVSRSTVRSALEAMRKRAEAATLNTEMPAGQRLRGKSTFKKDAATGDAAWVKTERETTETGDPEIVPPGFTIKSTATYVDAQGSIRGRWLTANQAKVDQFAAFKLAVKEVSEAYADGCPMIVAPEAADLSDELLNIIPFGDPHIGMLAHHSETGDDNHDLKIAIADLRTAIDIIVQKAPKARKALLVNLGDFFHAQDDRQLTPGHGHKLSVDGRWFKVLNAGLDLLVYQILRLLETHEEVEVINVPGNHDPDASLMLAMYLQAWFRNEPRVNIRTNTNPYDVVTHGVCFVGTAHGDGAKPNDLPGLFASRWPELWGRTKYRISLVGHVHHRTVKEHAGMTVETFRTLAAKDSWHSHKGYGSGRSVDVLTLDKNYGPISRLTIDIAAVRDAQ
jgi:hypothetical protein